MRQGVFTLAAGQLRSKINKQKKKQNPAAPKTNHEIHNRSATATTSRQRGTKHVPSVIPYSPASIDPWFVEIGLVQLSQTAKTTNVTHATYRQTYTQIKCWNPVQTPGWSGFSPCRHYGTTIFYSNVFWSGTVFFDMAHCMVQCTWFLVVEYTSGSSIYMMRYCIHVLKFPRQWETLLITRPFFAYRQKNLIIPGYVQGAIIS